MVCPPPNTGDLEKLFRHEVFNMLKTEGKITDVVIENMMNWRHSGFNVYYGKAIWPHNEQGLENLTRYIIRASFSQERMRYVAANDSSDGVSKVLYQSKDGTSTKTFDAMDWLAQLVTHIPNKGEQMVRYYAYYSNKSRGLRKKAGTDDQVPALIDSDMSRKASQKNWARLIQKIYHVDPLLCPKCSGPMRVISFIDDSEIIKKILKHLDLWDVRPNRLRAPTARRLKPLLSMINPRCPAWMITSSMLTIDRDLPLKKSSLGQTGELCSKWPEIAAPRQKINLDNKNRFDYSGMHSLFKWVLQYVGVQLIPVHNCPFSIHLLHKSNFLSFKR